MNEFNNYYIICHFIGREINYVYVYVSVEAMDPPLPSHPTPPNKMYSQSCQNGK